jgi:anti-anti-sigma factor
MAFSAPPTLHLVRLPGEFGPIVRCSGDLSVATAEALRRELALLEPLGHAVLTVNLSGCRTLDVDGILTLLHAFKRLRDKGRRLVLVAGNPSIARMLTFLGLDTILPTFPVESVAALALRGGGPPPPTPESWEAARSRTLSRWRAILDALEAAPADETLHQMTSMMALCERADEFFQDQPIVAGARCQLCPLFYALGGRPEDVGCRSVLEPMIAAVGAGRVDEARSEVVALIRTIEEMPLPQETPPAATGSAGADVRRET